MLVHGERRDDLRAYHQDYSRSSYDRPPYHGQEDNHRYEGGGGGYYEDRGPQPDYHRNSNMHQVSSSSYPPNGYMREQGDYRDSYQSQDYPRSQGDRNSNQERKSRFSGR